jgi:hypothetical protein
MKFDKPPFSKAYPELARILSARPEYAEGNSISNNLFFGSEAKQIKIQTGSLPESTGNTFVPAWPHQTNSIDFPFRLADYFNTQRAVNRFNPFKQYPNRSVPTIVPNEDNLAKCK